MQQTLILMAAGLMLVRGGRSGAGYEAFLRGAARGARSAWDLLPSLCAMLLMLGLMNASGLTALMCRVLSPLTALLGLPDEVAPLLALRPLSGSGSLSALKSILETCGADSRAGRAASVMMGSSETIFYTMTVYLAATDLKKLPWALPVSLVTYMVGVWVCAMCV